MKLVIVGLVAGFCYSIVTYTKMYPSECVVLLDKPLFSDKQNAWLFQSFTRNIVSNTYRTVIYASDTLKSILSTEVTYTNNGKQIKTTLENALGANSVQQGIEILRGAIGLDFEKQTFILKITATTKDPDISVFIVNALITQLNAFYNHQLQVTSQAEALRISRDIDKAKKDLEIAKTNILNFYQTNKLLTDNEYKRNNEIPPKLKYHEEKLKMEIDEKNALYQSLINRSNDIRLTGNPDMSLVTVMAKPEPSFSPLPRSTMKKTIIGGFLGLLIAGGYIFMTEFLKAFKEKTRKH